MRLLQLSAVLVTSVLAAQTSVTSPSSLPTNIDRPFAGGIGRYQQWYSPSSLNGGNPSFSTPVRMNQVDFFAGLSQSSLNVTLDMEVSIAHGLSFGLTSAFDNNYNDVPTIVLPRQNVQLAAGAPQSIVMTIPFATEFTWDWTRPIVLDIKIYGNNLNNQPFVYNNLGTTSGFGQAARLYSVGSPTATSGIVQPWLGMMTQFTGREGVLLEYGTGCAGEGQHVPDNTVLNLPWPGISWGHQLTGAASQRPCMWMIGDSNQSLGSFLLPIDVGTMLGLAPNGCFLLQNAAASIWTTTVGGGAGSGVANVSVNLPAVTSYVGMSLYTQWFVLDPLSPNGLMSSTQGGWSIVAPVGG